MKPVVQEFGLPDDIRIALSELTLKVRHNQQLFETTLGAGCILREFAEICIPYLDRAYKCSSNATCTMTKRMENWFLQMEQAASLNKGFFEETRTSRQLWRMFDAWVFEEQLASFSDMVMYSMESPVFGDMEMTCDYFTDIFVTL